MCYLCWYLIGLFYSFIQALLYLNFLRTLMAYIVSGITVFATLRLLYNYLFKEEKPDEDGYKESWFGSPLPNENVQINEDTSIRPFKIHVPDEVLSDLKSRLERTRLEEPVIDAKFDYGFNLNYLREVVEYWKTRYEWRKHEEELNKYPHFKTSIEGIDVHFMHIKPTLPKGSRSKIIPLLIVHGWPGSFYEFYKIIPYLTNPRPEHDFIFEVVCPSIPGYGFSESPHRKGFTPRVAARLFLTLMDRLGHKTFYVQGGGFGSVIIALMAKYYSSRVRGLHMNMYFSGLTLWECVKMLLIAFFPFLVSKAEYKLLYPLIRTLRMLYREGASFHIQSTKPDTLGSGMSDSPAGMAAYLLEKFAGGTNKQSVKHSDGLLTEKFTLDELLTNVMIYWVNNNFTAAARLYKEYLMDSAIRVHDGIPITVPAAIAAFPNEVFMYPKTLMSQHLKTLVSYNVMPRGGHFAAMEEPELLADDVWKFVSIVDK